MREDLASQKFSSFIVNQYAHKLMIKEVMDMPCDMCPAYFKSSVICQHKADFLNENNCVYDTQTGTISAKIDGAAKIEFKIHQSILQSVLN